MPSIVVLGARNLGGAILSHHLAAGWRGAAVARSAETLETVRGAGGLPLQADASDPDSLREALERARAEFGSLDVVVNAVSAARPTRPEEPFGGGPISTATVESFDAWAGAVAKQAFVFLSEGVRAGAKTLIQVTGGSARCRAAACGRPARTRPRRWCTRRRRSCARTASTSRCWSSTRRSTRLKRGVSGGGSPPVDLRR
ncbi:SDR family oxidoreductase [Solirubrobacter sp. CPCC 204708]|nr:SDR family oxidoreductase [Solirubrobacter deserti]